MIGVPLRCRDGSSSDGAFSAKTCERARSAWAQATMGDYSLFVTGAQFADGPGFVLLAGVGAGTERLLDSTCELAGTRVASSATASATAR